MRAARGNIQRNIWIRWMFCGVFDCAECSNLERKDRWTILRDRFQINLGREEITNDESGNKRPVRFFWEIKNLVVEQWKIEDIEWMDVR